MTATSRRLSAATPPDDIIQKHASQRDASPRRLLNEREGVFAGIPSGCRPFFQPFPVVSLALNHRLVRFDASGIGTVTLPESGY